MTSLAGRVAALVGWRRALLAVLAGMAIGLGHVPFSLPFLLLPALPVLFWLLEGSSGWRAAFGIGWLAGAGHFAVTMFWIVEPFLVDPTLHGWMAPFALPAMAFGLGLFWAVAFAAARSFGARGAALAVLLACLWATAEFARSHLLTGFPWVLPGYVWVETPVMQVAALLGPHVLGFLTLLGGLMLGLLSRRGAVFAGLLVAAGWGYGALRLAEPLPERTDPVVVRLVQPDAVQALKWDPLWQAEFRNRLVTATAAPGDPPPDVVIWPETAVDFLLGEAPAEQAALGTLLGPDAHLVLGLRRREAGPDGPLWFNSLAVLGADGSALGVYDKHHLVPFGEYMPAAGFVARLRVPGLETLTGSGFSAGPGARLVEVDGLPAFLPLICYEAIFPHGMTAPEGRADWLVQITNDAWFGQISGPYQHLAQARIRSIEQGLPLARAANTGISAMIDARGRVVASLGLGETGYLDGLLPAALPPTTYARYGDGPGSVAIASIFLLTVLKVLGGFSRRRRR